jgi:hypothetical protein
MTEQNHIDQHTLDVLNGAIDGELNTVEQAELEELLAGSDKVRDLNEELKIFTRLLDETPVLEPPEYLQSVIESQIRLPAQNHGRKEKSGFFATWLPSHWLGTGFALAAGAVLTITVYKMEPDAITAQDSANMVGTVVSSHATDRGELLDSIDISTDTLNGRIELRSKDDFFNLDVQLKSDGPTQVVVNFAGQELAFAGITHKQDHEDAISVTDASIHVASNGEQRYTVQLRRTSQGRLIAPLELVFFANNTLVYKAELSIGQ